MSGSFSYNTVTVQRMNSTTPSLKVQSLTIDRDDQQEYFVGDLVQHRSGAEYKILRMTNQVTLPSRVFWVSRVRRDQGYTDFQGGYKVREEQQQQQPGGLIMNMTQKLNTNNIVTAITTSLKHSKDVAIANQKGTAILTVLRTTIQENPLVPANLRALVEDSPYSDFILGLLLNVAAQAFSDNKTIIKAAKAANLVGSYDLANRFNQLETFIESTITSVMEPFNKVKTILEDEETSVNND